MKTRVCRNHPDKESPLRQRRTRLRSSLDGALSVNERPCFVPGNIRSDPVSRMSMASDSAASAASGNRTTCGCPVFIRSPGIRHSCASKSISCHVARRASPPRAAVSRRKRKHSFSALVTADSSTAASAPATSGYGMVRWCDRTAGCGGNTPSMASPVAFVSTYPCPCAQRSVVRICRCSLRAASGCWSALARECPTRLLARSGPRACPLASDTRIAPWISATELRPWHFASAGSSARRRGRQPAGTSATPPCVSPQAGPRRPQSASGS